MNVGFRLEYALTRFLRCIKTSFSWFIAYNVLFTRLAGYIFCPYSPTLK